MPGEGFRLESWRVRASKSLIDSLSTFCEDIPTFLAFIAKREIGRAHAIKRLVIPGRRDRCALSWIIHPFGAFFDKAFRCAAIRLPPQAPDKADRDAGEKGMRCALKCEGRQGLWDPLAATFR
jgi:hypothetical protein